jgi:hypothetical protein
MSRASAMGRLKRSATRSRFFSIASEPPGRSSAGRVQPIRWSLLSRLKDVQANQPMRVLNLTTDRAFYSIVPEFSLNRR